ncbi:DUF456 domain-containing protein [Pseudarthrobacter enclensis]|uniref:Uncharacterized protein YqgC (DUF456 family) n=1 Tax=Pseudarthrobacter enclensis TaxID=993070 RepID=A0ABT9RVB6_9MICC|nr:DUF456 domain-containing protein [Pseudarthrobacter enclensis]MDP9889175.1 uncharacterized protein YqgC (DUF456 family) [Pseudarthrobacter enclensis]
MSSETVVTILCGLAILVGVAGIIIPVLPGSVLIAVSLLAWAIWGGAGTVGWVIFAVAMVFVAAGMAAGALLTGRKLKQHAIPSRSVVVALAAGVVGMFVIPVVGLFAGFAAGLLVSEFLRTRNFPTAARSSWAALKATGLGMLAEFALACLAASTWIIGVWITASGS